MPITAVTAESFTALVLDVFLTPLHGLKNQHVMRDTALDFGPPSGTGKLIPLLLDAGTSRCTRLPPPTDGIFPTPHPRPHKFYSTSVTNELVRTLGLSDKTPPGLPGLKPSSNSVLPVAWITRPATDLRLQNSLCTIKFLSAHK